jgi:RimJ/RimL family protein N-acetyltransferase
VGAFLPIDGERVRLRSFEPADAPVLAAYRSDPEVAHLQGWEAPYEVAAAEEFVAQMARLTGPVAGDWIQIAVECDGELAGDVAVGLDEPGHVATLGYTLARAFQGRGLAREAVGAVVDRLFADLDVHRVEASLDPRNHASARVVEALGFAYEGTSVSAVLHRGEWTDDVHFALTADGHRAWNERPQGRPDQVRLIEITPDLSRAVLALETHWSQRRFVAPMPNSFADALFPPLEKGVPVAPWLRAIEADGELAGFMMIAAATAAHPVPYLWRLLIDRRHQRRGIGGRALDLLLEHLSAEGHRELLVSWHPGRGGPEPFYVRRGFVPTGEVDDDEIEARLQF